MFGDTYKEHTSAAAAHTRKSDTCAAPFNERLNAAASWNGSGGARTLDSVMVDITGSSRD